MLNLRKKSVLALAVTVSLLSGTASVASAAIAGPGPSAPVVTTPTTGEVPNASATPDFVSGMAGKKLVVENIHANDPTVFDASKDILVDPVTGARSAPMVGKVTQLETANGTAKLIQVGQNATRFEFRPKNNNVKEYVGSYFSTVNVDDETNPLRGATAQASLNITYNIPALPILGGVVLPNATAGNDEAVGVDGKPAGVGDILDDDKPTPDAVWIPNSTKIFGLTPEPVELKDRVTVIDTPEGPVEFTVWDNNSVSAELDSNGKAAEVEFKYAALDSNDATGIANVKLTVLPAETPAPELGEPPVDPNVPVTTPEAPAPELNEPPVSEEAPVVPSDESTPVSEDAPADASEDVTSSEEVPAPFSENTNTEDVESNPVVPNSASVNSDGDEMAITSGEAASEATQTNEAGFSLGGYVLTLIAGIGGVIFYFTRGKGVSA
jgi:hypothetical protein